MKFQNPSLNFFERTDERTHTQTSRKQYAPHFFRVGGITMMGRSPRCYIPSFMEICPLVPEKMFEGVLPNMGMAAILVM